MSPQIIQVAAGIIRESSKEHPADAMLRETLKSTGIPANAIVVQKGSTSELTSGLGNDADDLFEAEPQCRAAGKRRARGADLARRKQVLDNHQLAVRRPLLHDTRLTYLVSFGK